MHAPKLFAAALAAASLAARADGPAPRVRAGASLPPVAGLVRAVGGDSAECSALVREGADPHSFEPTPRDLAALDGASLYFSGTMDFERAMRSKLAARNPALKIVDLDGPGAAEDHDGHHGHGGHEDRDGHEDPHGWLSPVVLSSWADTVCEALSAAGVSGAEERRDALKARLAERLSEGRALLEKRGVKAFGTVHPAFGPFAEAFGLEQVALEKDGKDPGPRHVAAARARLAETGARVVFVQNGAERRKADVLVRGTALRVVEVSPAAPDAAATVARLVAALAEATGEDAAE